MSKKQNRHSWNLPEQKQAIGSAKAIATTARILLGLRRFEVGKKYIEFMVEQARIDKDLFEGGTKHILVPMLPLAVELCLKSLKAQGGNKFIKTHNLKSLWQDLRKRDRWEMRKRVGNSKYAMFGQEQREAYGIAESLRTLDELIEVYQEDFVDWRYVSDGVKRLRKGNKSIIIEEAFMDFFRIVNACAEYHKERY